MLGVEKAGCSEESTQKIHRISTRGAPTGYPPHSPKMKKKKKTKKLRGKDIDAVFEVCEAAGMTKRQTALAILGVYAKRGNLGPHMLAAYQRLDREERMGVPRLIL